MEMEFNTEISPLHGEIANLSKRLAVVGSACPIFLFAVTFSESIKGGISVCIFTANPSSVL